MVNRRIFIERIKGFTIERDQLQEDLVENFGVLLKSLRYLISYDIFNISKETLKKSIESVFSEPNKDHVIEDVNIEGDYLAIEFLPGQFDQRANSAMQCIKLLNPSESSIIKSGILIIFGEKLDKETYIKIKKYLINKVESREKNLEVLENSKANTPKDIEIIESFINMNENEIKELHVSMKLAMTILDFLFIQDYYINKEKRNPYETEIRVLDTYWSDHCRHTTFESEIESIDFSSDILSEDIKKSYEIYQDLRDYTNRVDKPKTLMDIATINAKYEFKKGNLNDLEVSDEVNAASIYIDVDVDGVDEKWLLMFKNETHNHPTEIEPFGGASTCIGGAIRDPLSGRSFVYQAMRITGAGDITEDISETLVGKLPQKVISKVAALGYSSYGNQIGLATSFVNEIYHEGYIAKRMEIGAVIGAVKADIVRREKPILGDIVILLGGKTGRDGIGGATGSSKIHDDTSIDTSSAEVQKGNAPEERKIQRLFRKHEVIKLIKKSNDFGAGGVSVAIGELADGIEINLNKVPTKYDGINGTELAISESQERMSVVISAKDKKEFINLCHDENIEAVQIATITGNNRLIMKWNDKIICDISRDFINTSGIRQIVKVKFPIIREKTPFKKDYKGNSIKEKVMSLLIDKNISEKQGLIEMFDSTVGKTTVLAPFGGKYQLTKTQTSVHKIPVQNKITKTVSLMAYGFNPYISEWSPYHGSMFAVIESMSKIVATGGDYKNIRFTFQEYFEKLNSNNLSWSKPLGSLLGAMRTLKEFSLSAIGGKDSMSGTYNDISVPPTLVSFAVAVDKENNIISPEFKKTDSYLYLVKHNKDSKHLPNFKVLSKNFEFIKKHINNKNIISATALEFGGLAEALIKSSFGNKTGFNIKTNLPLFDYDYGSILIESAVELEYDNLIYLGATNSSKTIMINEESISIDNCVMKNRELYKSNYPIYHNEERVEEIKKINTAKGFSSEIKKIEEVNVFIPVFPGTNCEYDSESTFIKNGANVIPFVFKNQTEEDINKSINEFVEHIDNSHIIMLSGGFSSGDEPDGSGKFIANVLRNKKVAEAITNFLNKKHLILGICNGFQALTKSGLLPYGSVQNISKSDPILFKNSINRHVSKFIKTKVSSISSPWLSSFKINDNHTIPISHGEGKFICEMNQYQELINNNQIAFQYVDGDNQATYNPMFNPNGSSHAIEGIISKDGLILGKMGHSERYEDGLHKNILGNKNQNIFINAINYFKGQVKIND